MKAVIIGAGQVGANLARYLSQAGKEVVVIESDQAKCLELDDALDVVVIQGSGTSPTDLKGAGLDDADLLVAVTASDETNLMSVLLASDYLPATASKMARLRSREYLENEKLRNQFKVDVVVNPEVVLGEKILRILAIPGARDVVSFEDGKVYVVAFRAKESWNIIGTSLKELSRQFGHLKIMVGAILRGPVGDIGRRKVVIPDGATRIKPGDLVYFLMQKEHAGHLSEIGVSEGRPGRSILIGGGGELSIQLADTLSQAGYGVRLLIGDPEVAVDASERLSKVIVLESSPANLDMLTGLLEEGVDTYIGACEDESVNVLTSVLAQKLGVDRTIVVSQDAAMMRLIKAVDINIVLNPFDLAAAFVLRNIHQVDVLDAKLLAGEDAEAIEFIPPDDASVIDKPLKDTHFPAGTLVAMIVRNGEIVIPRGHDRIQRGDRVIMLCRRGSVPALERMLCGGNRRR